MEATEPALVFAPLQPGWISVEEGILTATEEDGREVKIGYRFSTPDPTRSTAMDDLSTETTR